MTELADIERLIHATERVYDLAKSRGWTLIMAATVQWQAEVMTRRAEILKNTPKPPQSRRIPAR